MKLCGNSRIELKQQMLARVPEINALKNQGVIGENNQGLLEFRGSSQPNKGLIAAENKDRKAVYNAIAKQQGIDAALVGQRRAKQEREERQTDTLSLSLAR